MTPFEIAVPLIALTVAAAGAWLLRLEAHKIDARRHRNHPAE